jgi:hypothetical protein
MSTSRDSLYRRHRFPPEVISYAVWLYFRFPLSLRMVEEVLAARGICGRTKPCASGGRNSTRSSPTRSANVRPLVAINGIGMVCHEHTPLGGVWSWIFRDEGGPLDAGSQVQASNHCKLLSSKAMVVSVAEKGGT